MNAQSPYRPPGSLDVATALQPYAGPWNVRLAAHLARRAGFGESPDRLAALARGSMGSAVEGYVRFADTSSLPLPPDLAVPTPEDAAAMVAPRRLEAMQAATGDVFSSPAPVASAAASGLATIATTNTAAMAMPTKASDGGVSDAVRQQRKLVRRAMLRQAMELQKWWLDRMIATPAPLQEKMALFFHGHFTSTVIQKGVTPREIYAQNELFRTHALGNLRDLTLAVSHDPAMLKYLDNRTNVKAHPNENYARELLELFTLGIGNYTEEDVRNNARAFTGYTVRGGRYDESGGFFYNARQHDDGIKTFLGHTGPFTGDDTVAIVFQQPACAKFFATKLLGYLLYSDPEPELVDAFAAQIRKHDYQLAPVMSMLFRSNVFYSDRAYRALVKSPVEFVVGSYRLFGVPDVQQQDLAALKRMGQTLFYPPNVKGWDGGAAWLSSGTVLARENFASGFMNSGGMAKSNSWLTSSLPASALVGATTILDRVVQDDASPAAEARLVGYLDGTGTSALGTLSGENYEERMRGAAYLAMAMPAFQLA